MKGTKQGHITQKFHNWAKRKREKEKRKKRKRILQTLSSF